MLLHETNKVGLASLLGDLALAKLSTKICHVFQVSSDKKKALES